MKKKLLTKKVGTFFHAFCKIDRVRIRFSIVTTLYDSRQGYAIFFDI
jgi:hypothetical protein